MNDPRFVAGVLQFVSKFKYGVSKNKLEYFMFKPLSKKHSLYLVASSKKEQVNHYAVISFLKWDKSQSKVPYGMLVKLIGPCDKIYNTYEAILYKHQLTTMKAKTKHLISVDDNNIERHDIRDIYVFSVDPPGCEDIDDALSVEKSEDNITVGIHIADVSHYFDSIQINNFSTIYAPHQIINMIPDHFAKDICSLKPDKEHNAFSVFAKITPNGKIVDYWFKKTVLKSRKAYNYAELQACVDNDVFVNSNEKILYEIGRTLSGGEGYDTHKMVEVFMIMANSLVGKYLHDNAPPNTAVFRVHEISKSNTPTSRGKDIDEMLNILESKAAVYKLLKSKDDDDVNYFHSGLGILYYTHFTSPIRRYVDVYTHQLLYAVMNNAKMPPPPDINAINDYEKNLKHAEREFNKLKLAELRDTACEMDAIIMDFTEKAVCVYLSSYKMLHWINWVNNRDLRKLLNVQGLNSEEVKIEFEFSKKNLHLKKFETICIRLEATNYYDEVHKKISISIPIIDRELFAVPQQCVGNTPLKNI